MAKTQKFEIYRKVVNYHCEHQTGFPLAEGCKEIQVKPNTTPSFREYCTWLSGDRHSFEYGVGLARAVDSFIDTHLKGTARSKPNPGFLRLTRRLGLNSDNPTTDTEKQAIWEIQAAFGMKPTAAFYDEPLDKQRMNLKRDHPEIESSPSESNLAAGDDSDDEAEEESRDDNIPPLPSIDFRQRILDRSVGLSGAFGKSLYANLHKTFPNQTRGKADLPELVADCFSDATEQDVMNLFFVLRQTRQAIKDLGESEEDLLAELTVQATLRSIDPGFWLSGEKPVGGPNDTNARLSRLETRSSLVASLGFAGLYGLVVRIGFGRAPDGVYDLSEAVLRYKVSAAILCTLYDEARKRDQYLVPRRNPDEVLTEEEKGDLRDHFDGLRSSNGVAVLYIRPTVLDADHSETILSEVAQAINSRVILGSDQNRADLVRKGTELTVGSLEAKVRRALFASVNRGFSDGANPT